MLGRLRGLLLGRPKNLLDPLIHQRIALIAFFAWVGLGSDGLSSSSYGPEEAYLQLHGHHHLALYLMFAMVGTVFLISASYTQMIELFPSGGGGYLVGTKLLGPVPGLVSGCALIVEVKYQPPFWLHAVLWLPLILATTLLPLRAMKSLLIALQFHHKAAPGRLIDRQPK